MGIFLLILILIGVFITLLFVIDLKVELTLNTNRNDLHMILLWLYPLIRIVITAENYKPLLSFYLFGLRLFKIKLDSNMRKSKGMDYLHKISMKNVCINAGYGFIDPSTTGITCGAINMASQFINIASLNHYPDFMPLSDYIDFDAAADVNLGSTLVNFLNPSKTRRSVQWNRI